MCQKRVVPIDNKDAARGLILGGSKQYLGLPSVSAWLSSVSAYNDVRQMLVSRDWFGLWLELGEWSGGKIRRKMEMKCNEFTILSDICKSWFREVTEPPSGHS